MKHDNPTSYEELEENREDYQERMDELTPDGITLGTVSIPGKGTSQAGIEAFHELMTQEGFVGIEYCQEALHGNGEYFDRFDSKEQAITDFELYRDMADDDQGNY